jgi:hypothetical protein
MILLFFLSIVKLNKPSDTLSRDDISTMRRGNNPRNNGNDYRYQGSRGKPLIMQGLLACSWEDEAEEADERYRRDGVLTYDCILENSKGHRVHEDQC